MKTLRSSLLSLFLAVGLAAGAASVHAHGGHHGGIATEPAKAVKAPFDIVHTRISTQGNVAVFHMAVSGEAGDTKPAASGKLAGSSVFSYVWPTSLDPYVVGFESKA